MPTTPKNVETTISDHSHLIAEKLGEIAAWAVSEEDVRYEANKLLDGFIRDAGLPIRGRHEYGLAGGFIDSKYAGVLIEYKKPRGGSKLGPRTTDPGTRAAVEQLQKRFADYQEVEKTSPERLYGVSTDGRYVIYARYRGGEFQPEPPRPVSPMSIEPLLRAIVSLGAKGRAYTAAQLSEHFGSGSALAKNGVTTFYECLVASQDPKTKVFLKQWRLLFGEVTGYDVTSPSERVKSLAREYGLPSKFRTAELFFAMHTYYALFIKFLAAEIVSSFSPVGVSPLNRCARASRASDLRTELEKLEAGGIWSQLGITNFLEGDLFSWYLSAWNQEVADTVRAIVRELGEFDAATLSVEPLETRDLLKQLYQGLFPREVRHDLGEYYTPDWLAEYVLNELRYDGNPDSRILDPACGSGTFLVMIIARALQWFQEHRHNCGYAEDELVRRILKNVIGFDLNPLAVMTARTNYLIAIRQLIRHADRLELPIYLCDSVMTPAEYGGLFTGGELGSARRLPSAAGEWIVPREIASSHERIAAYCELLEYAVKHDMSREDFVTKVRRANLLLGDEGLHKELYSKLRQLDAKNQNGVWARIIKNAFAPLFIERVDFVAGNPPWINWESLPESYREDTADVWDTYGLRKRSGGKVAIGRAKHEMAGLFVYACADMYLRDGGRLGFVVTQSLFKNQGGDGFRRLALEKAYLAPINITDMIRCRVFEGATNRTATLIVEKRKKPFNYPVQWTDWRPKPGLAFRESTSLGDVQATVDSVLMDALPSDENWSGSPWLTCPRELTPDVRRVLGHSHYSANEGINAGGLVGAYWATPIRAVGKDSMLIVNLWDAGKIKVPEVEHAVERAMLYSYVRGRDVTIWAANASCSCVVPHEPRSHAALNEQDLRTHYPQTYAYFSTFKDQLEKRKSAPVRSLMEKIGFFALLGVGEHTFSPWKVVFKDLTELFQGAVMGPSDVSDGRAVLADYSLRIVPAKSEMEAHYICGLLNSSPARIALYYSSAGVQTQRYHAGDAEKVVIPRYEETPIQKRIAEASLRCHRGAARGEDLEAPGKTLDDAAAQFWNIGHNGLSALRAEVSRLDGSLSSKREEEDDEEEE